MREPRRELLLLSLSERTHATKAPVRRLATAKDAHFCP
jgi:hypothetical protein